MLVLVNHSDIQRRFRSLTPFLDERMRRLVAASESEAIGYGGVSVVARATGVSRRAITEGMKELKEPNKRKVRLEEARIRRRGAGRKRTVDKDSSLLEDLDRLVDPVTRGDPESPLRWTCKSVRRLAEELQHEGHAVSYQTVAELLHALDYSRRYVLVSGGDARPDEEHRGFVPELFHWRPSLILLAPHIAAFLQQRLPMERRASPNTCDSYAHAFRLLFEYASVCLKLPPSQLKLEQLDAPLIVNFLNHLETSR